ILEAQGESQRLRILALGAGTLDAKALTVLSLDTVSNLGNGQATKILFPFEFTRLMEGASEYLGTSRTVPDRSLSTLDELESRIGKIDDVLGPIPRQEELLTEIKSIEDEIKAETDESTAMVGGSIDESGRGGPVVAPPRLGPPEGMDVGSAKHAADPTSAPPAFGGPDSKKKTPPPPPP
ncbi:MAG: hypothetical protein L3K05_00890, partial [Thermoplasmata archaeon]|nr:hypothetical protein [Thermoplasmata archaeon]